MIENAVSSLPSLRSDDLYVQPRAVENMEDCWFYHTMDLPGHGPVKGLFDLRGNEGKYLGKVDFKGKRVLEIGTASGFLCFHMENQGAEVVAYDLSEDAKWDIVPFASFDHEVFDARLRPGIQRLNNAWWMTHRLLKSQAKASYGSVYDVPKEIGPVDISTFCAVLTHFENPFRALVPALSMTREKVIVTECCGRLGPRSIFPQIFSMLSPTMMFLPDARKVNGLKSDDVFDTALLDHFMSWWVLTPRIVKEYLGVLGFGKTKTTYHLQKFQDQKLLTFTVVGERTEPMVG